jgi:maltose alpha-D-glucosyltransferase/alpha-amylase
MIKDLWDKNAIVYCLSVGTYMDADGDGIGDFQGLMRRLDYLHGLGVTAIWLMPFQKSPGRDDGYDISDYYAVNPAFGSLGDFVEFTHGARQRGIRVLIDPVVNHTSKEHPWFQEARRDPKSRYHDWYVWSKRRPPHAKEGMAFPGVQKATWTYDEVAKAWYFHRFYDFQPDLNTAHPDVHAELLKIMGFWIQLGVSGFRMDVVPFVIGTKGADVKRPREQYDMLRAFREFLQWRVGDSIILAEANIVPKVAMQYFGDDGHRIHMMFNFHVNQHLFYALATTDTRPLVAAMKNTRQRPASGPWGTFLRNHDELDLGRLSEKQRRAVFDAFGPNPEHQLYRRGIRRRLAPMLGGDRRRLELANSLMFTLPGTPVLRYGDERAMGDDLSLPERTCGRTPCNGRPSRTAASPKARNRSSGSSAKGLTAFSTSMRPSSGATRIRCSTGPNASSACARSCPRLVGARSRSWIRATMRCWACATIGGIIRPCSSTISRAIRTRSSSPPDSRTRPARCSSTF